MNIKETAAVLAKIKLGDNREVTTLVIQEWHDAIGDLAYADAVEAVRMHRRDSTDYLMPAHVWANARLVASRRERDERIQAQAERRALPATQITLDRAEFERITREAIEKHRTERANA
ncbi:hypothetical protein [Humibacter sp.]|uniref:hypothetical protein n=1 Tax=Humibacter sp. TaxID=1940291 RepID=UPI003F7E9807